MELPRPRSLPVEGPSQPAHSQQGSFAEFTRSLPPIIWPYGHVALQSASRTLARPAQPFEAIRSDCVAADGSAWRPSPLRWTPAGTIAALVFVAWQALKHHPDILVYGV